MMHDRLKCNAVPIQLPIGKRGYLQGYHRPGGDGCLISTTIDLGKDMRVEDIPEDMVDLANEYREKLLDAVSDVR